MKTLFIDTHLNDILVYYLENGKVIDYREIINKKNNSTMLFPAIKEVLDKHSINEIIVINGPGSFTSVRLGVTIAKTLAYTLNVPIKVVSSLKAFSISSESKNVALSDGNGYYIGEFDSNYEKVRDYAYIKNQDINSINLEKYNTEYILNVEKVYEYMKKVDSVNAHAVKPIYIKKIGVEID